MTVMSFEGAADRVYVNKYKALLVEPFFAASPRTNLGALIKVTALQHVVVAKILVALTADKEVPFPIEVST